MVGNQGVVGAQSYEVLKTLVVNSEQFGAGDGRDGGLPGETIDVRRRDFRALVVAADVPVSEIIGRGDLARCRLPIGNPASA
jgi:hypothetical protein